MTVVQPGCRRTLAVRTRAPGVAKCTSSRLVQWTPRRSRRAAACRRGLLAVVACLALGLAGTGCGGDGSGGRRVIVLGIDGLDHGLLERFLAAGRLPNFASLAREGDFTPLETTMPPLSPVAWSTFITGLDPGGHGIFDFVHRDPATMQPVEPFYSIAPSGRSLALGSWVLPLAGREVTLYRRGQALWELLDAAGVDTTVFRMPVNFPPVETGGRSFAGMGTPDLLGTHGTYSFFTSAPPENEAAMTGKIELVDVVDDRVAAQLRGPPNPIRRRPLPRGPAGGEEEDVEYEHPDLTVDFEVRMDPDAPVARIRIQATDLVLNEGEWSDWVRVGFRAAPGVTVSALVRFYLQQVRPVFRLYVTPLQIDPADPALPLSNPGGWAGDLHDVLGPFYTQELPQETKAFSEGVFEGREFWDQTQFVYEERRRALDHLLDDFREGLLFFYFSSVDQGSHMLYRYADREHPYHEPDALLGNGIRTLYEQMDEALGRVREAVDDRTTLIVMSDHGFAPFHTGVNLNTWLAERGYVALRDPAERSRSAAVPRRRLVRDPRLRLRAGRDLRQPARARARRRGGGGRGLRPAPRRVGARPAGHGRSANRPPAGQPRPSPPGALPRPASGSRAGSHRRLRARLPQFVGEPSGRVSGPVFSWTTKIPGAATTRTTTGWCPECC